MWRIGHRGACGHAPENTLLSMAKALELGVDGFELDIHLSRDGVPVVIHDATLERTTNGTGAVGDYSLKELHAFDAGQGERIPSLADVLALVDKRCRLFIELKAENAHEATVAALKNAIADGWSYEQFYLCSFDHTQLQQIDRRLRVCALFAGIPASLAALGSDIGAYAINPCIHHMNAALVDDAHARGMQVFCWTANHAADIAKAKTLGADGIISDYPERL